MLTYISTNLILHSSRLNLLYLNLNCFVKILSSLYTQCSLYSHKHVFNFLSSLWVFWNVSILRLIVTHQMSLSWGHYHGVMKIMRRFNGFERKFFFRGVIVIIIKLEINISSVHIYMTITAWTNYPVMSCDLSKHMP